MAATNQSDTARSVSNSRARYRSHPGATVSQVRRTSCVGSDCSPIASPFGSSLRRLFPAEVRNAQQVMQDVPGAKGFLEVHREGGVHDAAGLVHEQRGLAL